MVYSCIFVTQISNNTNTAEGKIITSQSRNKLHADENIKTQKISGLANWSGIWITECWEKIVWVNCTTTSIASKKQFWIKDIIFNERNNESTKMHVNKVN